jgi:ABC-type glutathione transport system ATPase component
MVIIRRCDLSCAYCTEFDITSDPIPGELISLEAGGANRNFQRMVPDTSLSCCGLERFLGEEDSRVHALRGVSLDLEPGSIHAIVGPSGCGKSTLLYILGLLDRADSGTLTIDHQLVSDLPDDRLSEKRNELLGFISNFTSCSKISPRRKTS